LLVPASQALWAQVSQELIRSSVDYCRGYQPAPASEPRLSVHISDDKTILCYDGVIYADEDISTIHELRNGGIFVIRSRGGIPASATKIANILESKMATVVVRDYCMSACAAFLYIATARTYVVRHSVVAWHAPNYQAPLCDGLIGSSQKVKSWLDLPAELREQYCAFWALQASFFGKRGAVPDVLFSTKSTSVARQLVRLADRGVDINQLFWMWHPRYHQDIFTTKVTYESYPREQYEVDEIARTFGLSKIIYDP